MNETNNPAGLSRRQFLIKAGLATGALAAMPLQAQARFIWDGRPPLRVGLVVPESSVYPLMGESLVAGLKLSFAETGWKSTELVVEQTDHGSAIAGARRLLGKGQVDILTGMINPLSIHRLVEELQKSDVLYINMEGGANSYSPRDESPLVFHNSLGYWQSNWSLGSWAATAMGRRAFVAASLYETGYDAYYAFPQGFERAGGTVIRSEITHLAPDGNSLAKLMADIGAARPDFVYASYSGQEAVEFVRAYAAAGLSGRIPLVASGFTVDEALLPAMGAGAIGIRSCLSWSPALATAENASFNKGFLRRTGRETDPFALLGYDTGRLISEAVRVASGTVLRSSALKQALEAVAIASPRGALRVSPGTGSTDSPLYLREVRREGGRLKNSVIARLPGLATTEQRADRPAMTARSGWINTYLCA